MRVGISRGSVRTSGDETQTVEQIENESGKAIIQADKDIYNYVTRDQAKGLAERVYEGKSKLCSSYGWDTALKFIETQNSTYPTNSIGGYYEQNEATRSGYDITHPCNIYDMGGNVWEWTTESYIIDESNPYIKRGGAYNSTAEYGAAGFRSQR